LAITAFLTWLIYNNLPIIGDAWAPRIFGRERGGHVSHVIRGYFSGIANGNPRIGQFWLVFYGYFPRLHAAIFAFAIPALIWLLGAHIVGQNLKAQFNRVIFAGIITLAIFWFLDREIGATMYYQATSGNYLFAFLLLLTFLLPFRLALGLANESGEEDRSEVKLGPIKFVGWLIIAFMAGLGHETYGPTVLAGLAIVYIAAPLFKVKRKLWMIGGWVSFLMGYALLVFSPGQDKRYTDSRLDSVLVEPSVLIDRAGNLVSIFLGSGLWLLVAAILVGAARLYWKKIPGYLVVTFIGFIGLGLGMTLTGIGAPDGVIGERFVFAGHACLSIAICGLIFGNLKNIYIGLAALLVSGAYLGYEYVQTRHAYAVYNQQFDAQADAITSALDAGQTQADVPAYSLPFYDLKKYIYKEFPQIGPRPRVNTFIARYYGIKEINVVPSEATKTFGRKMVDKPLRLKFVNCPVDDGKSWKGAADPLGGLVCEMDYLVYFTSADSNWVVSGFQETPGKDTNLQFAVKRQVGEHPDSGFLPIWGGISYFDPAGAIVTSKGELRGWLTEPVYTNALKRGAVRLILDDCGIDDEATWSGADDPLGIFICGEGYSVTWDKATTVWKVTGLYERTTGAVARSSREIKGQTPDDGRINLLGGLYTYTAEGVVLTNLGKRVGQLVISNVPETGDE